MIEYEPAMGFPELDKRQMSVWTNGCIALKNREMDIVWRAVKVGTPIEIRP